MRQRDQIPTYDQAMDALEKGNDEVVAEAIFDFDIDDAYYIEQVINAVRTLLQRPSLTSQQIIAIGRILYGLERLPLRTSGIDIELSLTDKFEGDVSYCNLYLTEDMFSTDSGSICGSGFDRDSFRGPRFYVEPCCREYDGLHIFDERWPDIFVEMDVAEFKIVDCSDNNLMDLEHPDGSQFWEWIANHA